MQLRLADKIPGLYIESSEDPSAKEGKGKEKRWETQVNGFHGQEGHDPTEPDSRWQDSDRYILFKGKQINILTIILTRSIV